MRETMQEGRWRFGMKGAWYGAVEWGGGGTRVHQGLTREQKRRKPKDEILGSSRERCLV